MNIFLKAREVERRARLLSRTMSWYDAVNLVLRARTTDNIPQSDIEQRVHFAPLNRDLFLRPSHTDLACYEKIFVSREYDVPFTVQPSFIVDAGANVGLSTLRFKQQFPQATIVAIEPEANNYALLKRNCESLADVHLLNTALWSNETQLAVSDPRSPSWSFKVSPPRTQEECARQVDAVTIDGVLRKFSFPRIDLLKIDIEGAELDLFSKNCESWLHKVDVLVIELHDRFRPGCSKSFYAAISRHEYHQEVRGENIFIRFIRNKGSK